MHKCMRMYELGKSFAAFAASLELMETQIKNIQKHTNDLKQRIWMSNVQTLILLSLKRICTTGSIIQMLDGTIS